MVTEHDTMNLLTIFVMKWTATRFFLFPYRTYILGHFHYTRFSITDFSLASSALFFFPDYRTLDQLRIYRTKKAGSGSAGLFLRAKRVYASDREVTRDQQQAE